MLHSKSRWPRLWIPALARPKMLKNNFIFFQKVKKSLIEEHFKKLKEEHVTNSHIAGAWSHKHGLIIIIRSLKRSFLKISRSLQFKLHLYFAITKSQIFNSTLTTRFRVKGKNPSEGSTDRQVRRPIGPNWSEIFEISFILVRTGFFSWF